MSLEHWLQNGHLRKHDATVAEVQNLLRLVDRELSDAAVQGLSECSSLRHHSLYDAAGVVAETDALELLETARALRKFVLSWLHANHPKLLPKGF